MYKHYITIDDRMRILSGWSDGVHPEWSTEGAILLRESGERRFRLLPEMEINQPLDTEDGIPLYKWEADTPVPRTAAEIKADREAIPQDLPSAMDVIEAQVIYTAMMTDTMLEV